MSEYNRQDILERYGADNLDYIVNEYEEILEEETNLNETVRFASSVVGAVRTAGFSLTCGELERLTYEDEEDIRTGVEVINEQSEYISGERDISLEGSVEYLILYINNMKPSQDFAKIVHELYSKVLDDEDEVTPVSEDLESFDNKVEAATIAYIASNTSHYPDDTLTIDEASDLFHVDVDDVVNCYFTCWDSNDYRLKDNTIDSHGVLKHIREDLIEELDLSDEDFKNSLYRLIKLAEESDEYTDYDNKSIASIIVSNATDYGLDETSVSTNESKARRIGEKLGLLN